MSTQRVTPHPIPDRHLFARTSLMEHRVGVMQLQGGGDTGKPLTATWLGGDVIGVTPELLAAGDPKHIRRDGDEIQLMQYRMKIIGVDYSPPTYVCKRIDEDACAETEAQG